MIPRRVIVTYKSRGELSPVMSHCWQQMQKLHPQWEVRFFSDRECRQFVAERNVGYLELYDWFVRPVQKADFFRVYAVHELGGFYLDADVLLSAALDPLCLKQAVFPAEWDCGEAEFNRRFPPETRQGEQRMMIGQYAFGARAGHPFLAEVLKEMVLRTAKFEPDDCHDSMVLHSTGPDLITTCYYRERKRWKDVTILRGAANIDKGEMPVHGKDQEQRFGHYGKHLIAGTWRNKD